MNEMIKTSRELLEYFKHEKGVAEKRNIPEVSCYVSSRIRKEWMVSNDQGKMLIDGWFYNLYWQDMKGGVWKVSIDLLERP